MTREFVDAQMVMYFLEQCGWEEFDPPASVLGWCGLRDAVGKDRLQVAEGGSEVTEGLGRRIPEIVTDLVLREVDLDLS